MKTDLVREHDPSDTLRVPEELVHVIVSDDVLVIPLSPHELPVDDFVSLVADEVVERLDHGTQVQAFGDGVDTVLTFGRAVVVVRALEDKA